MADKVERWKARKMVGRLSDYEILAKKDRESFIICDGLNKEDAKLIVAAVNACISINPPNPMAVAEKLEDMYELVKYVVEHKETLSYAQIQRITVEMATQLFAAITKPAKGN
jgi:hypothetical protein